MLLPLMNRWTIDQQAAAPVFHPSKPLDTPPARGGEKEAKPGRSSSLALGRRLVNPPFVGGFFL